MSNIQLYSTKGKKDKLYGYIYTLQYYIKKALRKIETNDKDITWYICEEGDFPRQSGNSIGLKRLEQLSGVIRNPIYGKTIWNKGDSHSRIYISTQAIETAPLPQRDNLIRLLKLPQTENLLINVILDELAHAKTHEDHGNKLYDELLNEYASKYYNIQSAGKKSVVEEIIKKRKLRRRKSGIPWKL